MTITPTLNNVYKLADELGLERPIGNRACFDVWFVVLHELGHVAPKPQWYKNYAKIIRWEEDLVGKPCAPVIPGLLMLADPTPDEEAARLWAIQVCQLMGWTNPVIANPEIFGGSNYNARQWFVEDECKISAHLKEFGVDVLSGKLVSDQSDIYLPSPTENNLESLLRNHNYIYRHFNVDCHTSQYSNAQMTFLKSLCDRLV